VELTFSMLNFMDNFHNTVTWHYVFFFFDVVVVTVVAVGIVMELSV
jgi:hypothetical protein